MPYENHPIADAFPLMSKEDLSDLAGSILVNGQKQPIILYQKKILEGRNRYLATQLAKVEPVFQEFTGDNPYQFAAEKHFASHKYKSAQRAMMGARLVKVSQEQQYEGVVLSNRIAGEFAQVHYDVISEARRVIDYGTPEEIRIVDSGEKGLMDIIKAVRLRGKLVPGGNKKGRAPTQQMQQYVKHRRTQMVLWKELRDAMESLSHMPKASEMVRAARAVTKSSGTLKAIPAAIEWLIDFNHEIEKSKLVQKDEETHVTENSSTTGNGDHNARHGDEAVGPQHAEPPSE